MGKRKAAYNEISGLFGKLANYLSEGRKASLEARVSGKGEDWLVACCNYREASALLRIGSPIRSKLESVADAMARNAANPPPIPAAVSANRTRFSRYEDPIRNGQDACIGRIVTPWMGTE